MKKKLLMVVLCAALLASSLSTGLLAGAAFSATEQAQLLYPVGVGAPDASQANAGVPLGAAFTVSGGNFVGLRIDSLKTSRPAVGQVSIYKWNTDYAQTVAAAPVYQDFFMLSGVSSAMTSWVDSDDVTIRFDRAFAPGKYLAVIKQVSGEVWVMVHGAAEEVTAYQDGQEKAGWSYKLSYLADPEAALDETPNVHSKRVVNLYGTGAGDAVNYGTDSNGGTVLGTRFAVSDACLSGFVLSSLNCSGPVTGTISVYKWNSDYATTTAAEPVVRDTVLIARGGWFDSDYYVVFDHAIEAGEYLVTLSSSGAMYYWLHAPVEGVTCYTNGTEYPGGSFKIQAILDTEAGNASDGVISHKKSFEPLYDPASGDANASSFNNGEKGDLATRFTVSNGNFAGVMMDSMSWDNLARIRVFAWDTDYNTTVAQTPLIDCFADRTFASGSNSLVMFDEALAAGEYLILFSGGPITLWVHGPVDGVKTYVGGTEWTTGTLKISYVKDVDTSKSDEGEEPPVKQAVVVPIYGAGAAQDERADFLTNVSVVGAKFAVTEGKFTGFVLHNIDIMAAANVSVYKWNTDYATTVKGKAMYTCKLDDPNHVDRDDYTIRFAPLAFAEGDYLVVVEGGETRVWAHNVCEGVTTFLDGQVYAAGTMKASYLADPNAELNENPQTGDNWATLAGVAVLTLLAGTVFLRKKSPITVF